MANLRVGIDLVHTSDVAHSIAVFGERYLQRIFTLAERQYADAAASEGLRLQRLAARLAAREAAIKAFELSEVGVNWRDLEVVHSASGAPALRLVGRAKAYVGEVACSLSMSHHGEWATAVVVAM